jgi:hypothetical protein
MFTITTSFYQESTLATTASPAPAAPATPPSLTELREQLELALDERLHKRPRTVLADWPTWRIEETLAFLDRPAGDRWRETLREWMNADKKPPSKRTHLERRMVSVKRRLLHDEDQRYERGMRALHKAIEAVARETGASPEAMSDAIRRAQFKVVRDAVYPGFDNIFKKRGIPLRLVVENFQRWDVGDQKAFQDAWRRPPVEPKQYPYIDSIGDQVGGYVMRRDLHPAAEAAGFEPILAEIRPDEPVVTGWTIHDHDEVYADWPKLRGRHIRKEHDGGDVVGPHRHLETAKYLFPPGPKRVIRWKHDHDVRFADDPEGRALHVAKRHPKGEPVGLHSHTRKVKDKSVFLAQRIACPTPVSLLKNPPRRRVFFPQEGCLKAASILGQDEPVFSVPSVTLWRAPELEGVLRYHAGQTIVIVPDADWRENWLVITQAMMCRAFACDLSDRLGLGLTVVVAAPPLPEDAKRDPITGKPEENGVDDFIAAGIAAGRTRILDDLEVVSRELPPRFGEWARKYEQWAQAQGERGAYGNGIARDIRVMQALALYAGTKKDPEGRPVEGDGEIRRVLSIIADIAGIRSKRTGHPNGKSVATALERLAEGPGLDSPHPFTVEGSLDTVRGKYIRTKNPLGKLGWHYDPEEAFKDKPIFTVAEELLAIEGEKTTLGELPAGANPQQFVMRDVDELLADATLSRATMSRAVERAREQAAA